MKRTAKINISGIIFYLDEDAYEKLNSYMESINKYFSNQEGGDEIIKDIELRIAELFQLKLTGSKEVVTLKDVQEIINKLGKPEEFSEEDKKESSQASSKRLYRDPDNAILGGVASGIGRYLKIDPVWIRLIFILLLLGYGLIAIIYILFWLIIPKAETYEQKLEMKGENISISNIEEKVKKEYSEVKNNLEHYKNSKEYRNFSTRLNEIFVVLGSLIKAVFKFIAIIIGVGLIIAGVVISFYFVGIPIFDLPFSWIQQFDIDDFPLLLLFNSVFDPLSVYLFITSVTLLALIPILFLIYLMFRLVGFKGNDKIIFITGITLWVISLFLTIGVSLWQVKDFAYSASTKNSETFYLNENKELRVFISEKMIPDYYINEFNFDDGETDIAGIDNGGNIYMMPEVIVEKSSTDEYEIEIRKTSRGKSFKNAATKAGRISYNFETDSGKLTLFPYFIIPANEEFRLQQVTITLSIPEGKKIYLSEKAEKYLEYIANDQGYQADKMGDKIWVMKENKLEMKKSKSEVLKE